MVKTRQAIGTYYIGATIADINVLRVVRNTNMLAQMALNIHKEDSREILSECHMTLVPPFHTTYEEATALNMGAAFSRLRAKHPLMRTRFSLRKMMTLVFADSSTLCFQIKILGGVHQEKGFTTYVEQLRKEVFTCDHFNWRKAVPLTFTPHITILSSQDIAKEQKKILDGNPILWNKGIRALVEEINKRKETLPFLIAYPTVYAKYDDEWRPLGNNPVLF